MRTPGEPVARHLQLQGSEASPAARTTLDSARIPRTAKLLICGLFQKGRVLAQDAVGVVYNTFPLPPGFADADTSALEPIAQAVLDARAAHAGATLADLYDPDLMPPNLRRAHHALDRAVDRLYRRARFTSEGERVEYLFALYERMQTPLAAAAARPRARRRRRVT